MNRRLHLPIQEPCHENWDAMHRQGDARRFCDVCTKNVHDISAMTESEARTVLTEESAKGRVCVRYRADERGNIKFRQPTVTAPPPNLWRSTLAAAGMTLALLTGCTDSEPDRVLDDRCVYEVGPWSFTAARGQGTCPDVEPEHELLGKVEIDPEPEPEIVDVKGEIAPIEPEPEVMGEAPIVEPERPFMGALAGPIEPPPQQPEVEIMGDVAVDPANLDGPADPPEAPCDPAAKPEHSGPRRL